MNKQEYEIEQIQGFSIYAIIKGDIRKAKKKLKQNNYTYTPIDGLPNHTDELEKDYNILLLCASLANNEPIKLKDFYEYWSLAELFHLYTIILANKYEPPTS